MDFSVPTIDEVRSECFETAAAAGSKGFRQNAWLKLLELAKTNYGYGSGDKDWTKELRHIFFQISPSPIELLEAEILAGRDAGWGYSRTLADLYANEELNLIKGEGYNWMQIMTKKHQIIWQNFALRVEPKFNPREEFLRLLDEYYDDVDMSRKQAWNSIKHLLKPQPIGLFIKNWPFTEGEFREIAMSIEGSRLDIWNALIDEMIITPGNPKELRAFEWIFFQVSRSSDELIAEILKRKREMPRNRSGVRDDLNDRFGDQLLPGELDFQLDKFWKQV